MFCHFQICAAENGKLDSFTCDSTYVIIIPNWNAIQHPLIWKCKRKRKCCSQPKFAYFVIIFSQKQTKLIVPIVVFFSISSRHLSVSVRGHIEEHDGAVERPHRCQLLQDHSNAQERPGTTRLRPLRWQRRDGLSQLPVAQHGVHHAARCHGQCTECPQQSRDGGDNRSVRVNGLLVVSHN